jgi:hypothetical protein
MKNNNFLLILGASLILVSMLALSPFKPAQFRDVSYTPAQLLQINSINAEMQSIAGKYGSLTAITDSGDLLAYRWLAMARQYIQLASLATPQGSNLGAINTEMSNIVAKYGSLTAVTDQGDLLAYRWLAMAKQYVH